MAKVIGLDSASQGNFTAADLEAYKAHEVDYIELYSKWSTPALTQLIHSMGIGIAVVVESTVGRARLGYGVGYADGKAFLASVPAKFGVPALPAMVAPAWADDEDTTAEEQPAVLEYARGWSVAVSGFVRRRCYANGAVCQAAKAAGLVDFDWTMGGSGTSGTAAMDAAGTEDERQEVGDKENIGGQFDLDSDVAVNPDLSWIWWPDGDPRQVPPPAPVAPPPVGPTPEPPVPVTPTPMPTDQIKALVTSLQQELAALGYYTGPIDGDPGPMTQAALQAWR